LLQMLQKEGLKLLLSSPPPPCPELPATLIILSLGASKDKRQGSIISVVLRASIPRKQPLCIVAANADSSAERRMNCYLHHHHHHAPNFQPPLYTPFYVYKDRW
jgi:hypothetical protein